MGLSGFSMINTQGAVIFGMVYNVLPYMVIQIHSALTKIDNSLIEAAQDLGANAFKTFLKVIFPLSLPGVISGVMMVFVPSVSAFVVSKMLGGGSTLLVGDLIEMQFLGNSYNPHLGSAISLFLIVLIMTCMGIMNQFESGETHNADMVM
jgi:spermidine/putrescine transport system permease protein